MVEGDISIWYRASATDGTYGYMGVFKYDDGVKGTAVGSSKTTKSTAYTEFTATLDEPSQIMIELSGFCIDDVTVTYAVGLTKPKGLVASNITTNSANLSWNAGGTETTWEVSYSTTSGAPDNGTIVSVTETTYSLTGLTAETTYYAAVRAKIDDEYSAWSKEVSFTPSKAVKLTVNDGTSTNSFIPIYGNYVDYYDKVEFVIPASDLADMANSDIKALQFYMSSPAAVSWGAANFKIYMKEVDYTTISSYAFTDDDTPLYNGAIDGTTADMAITLSTSYHYDGGNLLIGVYNTAKGTYKSSSFYGVSATLGASAYGTNSSSLSSVTSVNQQQFLPKTTFTYLPVDGPVMKVSDTAFDFGTITVESAAEDKVKTFTISNKGNATLEGISVSYSGDDVFSLSDGIATSIAEGGEAIEVSVTMSTETPGNYSGTITVSATDQTPVEIAVTGIYAANPASMAISLGEETVGETVAFGNIGKQTTKMFTVTNEGNLKLNVTIASNNTTDFTVSPAALEVAGSSSETFTVTFVYPTENPILDMEKTATITVTPSNEGLTAKTFTVTGTRIEQWSEDFSGNALPEGWETTSTTYWTFADGVAKGGNQTTSYWLTTPSLVVEEGASMSFDVYRNGSYVTLEIEKQKNNGNWESCNKDISYSDITNNSWKTFSIDGLEAGNYKFRFNARGYWLDNFQGFKRNMNDPKMGIYSDAECTTAITSTSVTKDFGFASTDQTANYYIKNDGTGTMTLSLGENPDGITATLDKTSVAAGEHATLTITMPATSKGYNGGNVVVTATDLGTFTVATSGVIVEDGKLNLNFATDNIPATWTAGNWSKNDNGYVRVGYYSTPQTMLTSNLSAEAGEDLVIIARQEYTSSSYSFGVKYKKTDAEEWSDLIPAANIGTSYVTLHGTIAEAGTYLLQFNGQYTQIQRIYGLSEPLEPVMVVYDGENQAADSHNFGNVSDEADASWTLTVKNEGHATLTGLAASLTGDNAAHYSYEITGTTGENNDEIAVNAQATITVKQLKDNLGSHNGTLTISATGLDSKVIALSGTTRDHTKLFVDFENNAWPTNWTNNNWTIATTSGNNHARAGYNVSSLITCPLTVTNNETLSFKAKRQYSNSAPTFQIRYTTNGGLTWTEYVDYASQVTSSDFANIELTGIPAGIVVLDFNGRYVDIDDISGFAPTTAPMLALTEGTTVVADGDTKAFGNLTSSDGVATYTLTNSGTANMVSNVYTTGWATAAFSGEGEGVTLEKDNSSETYNKVTLAPGKSATLTLTMPFGTTYGQFDGTMVIETEGWVGDMTVNYTANLIDPTAVNETFATTSKPEGWYNGGWTFNGTNAYNSSQSTEGDLITSLLTVSGEDDILTFDARAYFDGYSESLTVSYSTDRVSWTDKVVLGGDDLTGTDQTFEVKGLSAGNYYLKFTGKYIRLDNIMGWHYATPAPEHDLYIPSVTYPSSEGVITPGTEITVTATVASLRANEEGVYTKLYYRDADHENQLIELATSTTSANISKDGTQTFTMTANVPTTESHYRLSVGAFLSDGTEPFHTGKSNLYTVAHTRTLEITGFALTSEATVEADANNQFTSTFNVTVQNTGTVALPAGDVSVSITDADGNAYETATWTAANSQTVFCNPGEYMNDGAVLALHSWGNVETWTLFEETNISGFYSAELNGNTNFNIVRLKNSSTEGYNSDNNGLNWDNKYNQSTDMSTSDGNVFTFKGWNDKDGNGNHWFTYGTMAELATGISTTLEFTVTTSAQEGGVFTFKAKENVSNSESTAQTVTVTAHAPRFALYESENAVTAGDEFNYGTVKAPATVAKTFTIKNEGNAPLEITGYAYPMGYTVSPAFPSNGETIAVGESKSYTMTLDPATTNYEGVVNDNFSIEYTVDNTTKTFSVHFSGRAVTEDTWMVDFEDGVIPSNWDNSNNWTVGESDGNNYATLTGWDAKSIVTPRLLAEANEELTFDVLSVGNSFTYAYSTDKNTWSDEVTVSAAGEQTFTAPAAGNYYLRFTTRNGRLDNLIGFQLNPVPYEIASSNIPASVIQYADYTATVNVKKNTGANENVTAKLYVNNVIAQSETKELSANTTTEFTLTYEPQTVFDSSVEAYIEISYGENQTLATEKVNLTITAAQVLDEAVGTVAAQENAPIVLSRSFVQGWNTVCLPFAVSDLSIFGDGTKAYEFSDNTASGELKFTPVTSMTVQTPYLLNVPAAITEPVVLKDVTISSLYTTLSGSDAQVSHNGVTYQGSYAPVEASVMDDTKVSVTNKGNLKFGDGEHALKGFRAYFTGLTKTPTARLSIMEDDTTTKIIGTFVDGEVAPDGTYNLQGQKVQNLKKGLYIMDGKKVVRK